NPKTKKGGMQLDYVKPLSRGVSGYVQLFHGYGQSLIDYNQESTAVGIGIMLNDWMGL
ncbi:MAG: phospholipase A, partial [Moraxella sp.]|nr:phospholipase A [Moraxella sp.]